MDEASVYLARGVSATKTDLHRLLPKQPSALFPNAFCKVLPDVLNGDEAYCTVLHTDGAGTKSLLAYLKYRETDDVAVFEGIAQDSIVMNVDDLLCVGVTGGVLIASTLNRHAERCGPAVLEALLVGQEKCLATLREGGFAIHSAGGETADVGDIVETLTVDSSAVARLKRSELLGVEGPKSGQLIVGLASYGQATYEHVPNSGIGSNGLTAARHDLLSSYYKDRYRETWSITTPAAYVYSGPLKLEDPLPTDKNWSVGEALLSPTRTYAPVVAQLLDSCGEAVGFLAHCSGGGQTKCLRFGKGLHFIKDNLLPIPPIFQAIAKLGKTPPKELYQVYNMGHRLEVYCEAHAADTVVEVAESFGIAAQVIGRVEASGQRSENRLTLKSPLGSFSWQEGG